MLHLGNRTGGSFIPIRMVHEQVKTRCGNESRFQPKWLFLFYIMVFTVLLLSMAPSRVVDVVVVTPHKGTTCLGVGHFYGSVALCVMGELKLHVAHVTEGDRTSPDRTFGA
jgi:hypothetical protein